MSDDYVLGSSEREHERLDLQGLIYRDITRRALVDGGIASGMRVLDIGCGSGDVSRQAAELVGAGGSVLGIDRDPQAIESSRARAAQAGLTQARFELADVLDSTLDAGFDALVGRFVLMHQPDPAAVLARAAELLAPGGRIVMIESHLAALLDGHHSLPYSATFDRLVRWQCEVISAAGADLESGLRLHSTFAEAGLPAPALRLEAVVAGGPDSLLYDYVVETSRSMLPMARTQGIGGLTEADLEGLAARLRDEVTAGGGVLECWPVVVAHWRVPDQR